VLALAPRLTEGAAIWRARDAMLPAATGWLDTSLDAALAGSAANTTARAFYAALGFREEDVRLTLLLEPSDGPRV
jgi:hypothetical protein